MEATMQTEKIRACGKCKASTWRICPLCSRYYCEHHGSHICWHCVSHPEKQQARVGTVYVGRMSAVVWRTPHGAYRHQGTGIGYYRRKDAVEMLAAAERLGYTAHLQEIGHYSKWRDYYGRPCGVSDPTFHLWVEMSQTVTPAEVGREIAHERADDCVAMLMKLSRKPRSEWSYQEQETYCRLGGML
jgi:hypothetical protein